MSSPATTRGQIPPPGPPPDGRVILTTTRPAGIKARGRGMMLRAGYGESPFGRCLVAECRQGICHLSFADEEGDEGAIAEMHAAWPLAESRRDDEHARELIEGIFSRVEPVKVFICGTPFQLRVWRALLRVPLGAVVSYGGLAAAAGHPRACRATGSAVGANPVALLIPCHRVVRASGDTGHYRWGSGRKRAILEWEAMRGAADSGLPDATG